MLSHLHEDHMRGIYDKSFEMIFNNVINNKILYASPLTITYIKRNKKLNLLSENLKPLEVGFPRLILVNSEKFDYILLTLLPAGHCPGSVMLFIEVEKHKILYTV